MSLVIQIAMVAQMLMVNISTVHTCSRRRRSLPMILAILAGFSVVVFAAGIFLVQRTPAYGNGNGLFALIGFVFLPVLKLCYDETWGRIFETVCSGWIYSMLVFSVSVHIAKLVDPAAFLPAALIAQTALYLATFLPFHRFIRDKLVYVLKNIPDETGQYLRLASILWFLTVVAVNAAFVLDSAPFKLAAMLLLACNALMSYRLIHVVVRGLKDKEQLERIALRDDLTGLPNRTHLMRDLERKLIGSAPFTLIYLDLDDFKRVNDRFGHLAGDEYLRRFARTADRLLLEGTLYRIAGDEFVCLYTGVDLARTSARLRSVGAHFPRGCPFLGVSMGVARFPEDAKTIDALIAKADHNMYASKKAEQGCSEDGAQQ